MTPNVALPVLANVVANVVAHVVVYDLDWSFLARYTFLLMGLVPHGLWVASPYQSQFIF